MTTEAFNATALFEELTRQERVAEAARLDLSEAQKRANEAHARLKELRSTLADPSQAWCNVTDHAVLRYAEHALGLNSEEVRHKIRTAIAPLSRVLGYGKYPVGSECVAVVQNGTVVTVLPK